MEALTVFIRYHTWWPSANDPFYVYNVTENRVRNDYYGNNYTPHFFIDGAIDAGSNHGSWGSRIDDRSLSWAPLEMSIAGVYDEDTRTGQFTVTIYVEDAPGLGTTRLRIALTETDIQWNAPNGSRVHDQTFRDMIPSTYGQPVTLTQGETLQYTFDLSVPEPLNPDNCMLVAFVQSDQSREILQGARKAVPELTQTAIDDEVSLPENPSLLQNYPNPFNAGTKIDFYTRGGDVRLTVYDLSGAAVRTLVDNSLEAGLHSIVWDGTDDEGHEISSGVYFYRLSDSGGASTNRMTLLK